MNPFQIDHLIETVGEDDQVDQIYNYLIYRFEGHGAYIWARAYLYDVQVVSVHGPFKSSTELTPVPNQQLFVEVTDYLRKRFVDVQTLGPKGYVKLR